MSYNYDHDDESGMAGDPGATMRVPKPAKPPQMFDVPRDTPPAGCPCGATIYFTTTAKGARMPVRCDVEGGVLPIAPATERQREQFALSDEEAHGRDGRGISHYVDCPRANDFRKRGK